MDKDISKQATEFYLHTSYDQHKKQRFWQILFPIGLGILFVIGLAVLVALTVVNGGSSGEVSVWADTSMIWLSLPVLVFAVLMALILFALVYLLAKLLRIVPTYSSKAQYYADQVSSKVKLWSGKLIAPILKIKNISARISTVFSNRSRRLKK